MRILVTGGAGFIGSHLVEALLAAGHSVRVLDNLFSGRKSNLKAVRRDVEFLEGDCSSSAAARRAARGVEVIFHEAAVPSVARSVRQPLLSHHANATATLSMLEAAREGGVRRFIYAGSSSVYGNSPSLPKNEEMTPCPRSPYAVGKLSGEHYLRVFAELHGIEALTLRYFNVFGPRQDPGSPYSGVISRFATALLSGKPVVVNGDGHQSRDFTYVANVVDANLRALEARGLSGQAVNVATGSRVSLRALIRSMARIVGRRPRLLRAQPRQGDVRHSLADLSLAQSLLGYGPRVEFETGLRRTLEWYREHSA